MSGRTNTSSDERTGRRLKRLLKLKRRELERRILDRRRAKRPPAVLAELRRELEALARAPRLKRAPRNQGAARD